MVRFALREHLITIKEKERVWVDLRQLASLQAQRL